MSRDNREQAVEFTCVNACDITWMIDGRFNASGEFEPEDLDDLGSDMDCPECGDRGEPTDSDVRVADV